ncbi:MAG: sulfotransferase [Pirellulales bacterium]|nr:sulfotransferase [Pirellulales bacterium]
MLAAALGLSSQVKNYGEGDPKYFCWEGAPRLLPLELVAKQLTQERHPFTLLKPLCESQRVEQICRRFPSTRGVWIVRHYQQCVASHVNYYRQFHDAAAYVQEMLQFDRSCWKNENLGEDVKAFLAEAANRTLSLETAYALYWLARNSLLERLPPDLPIRVVHYEDLLQAPVERLREAFVHLGIPFHARYALAVNTPTHRRAAAGASAIDDDVARQCEILYRRLRRPPAVEEPAALHDVDAVGV